MKDPDRVAGGGQDRIEAIEEARQRREEAERRAAAARAFQTEVTQKRQEWKAVCGTMISLQAQKTTILVTAFGLDHPTGEIEPHILEKLRERPSDLEMELGPRVTGALLNHYRSLSDQQTQQMARASGLLEWICKNDPVVQDALKDKTGQEITAELKESLSETTSDILWSMGECTVSAIGVALSAASMPALEPLITGYAIDACRSMVIDSLYAGASHVILSRCAVEMQRIQHRHGEATGHGSTVSGGPNRPVGDRPISVPPPPVTHSTPQPAGGTTSPTPTRPETPPTRPPEPPSSPPPTEIRIRPPA